MKELSIEEKARRYDEALEKAKEYWDVDIDNTMNVCAKGTMEYLFPELKESEDERIFLFLCKTISEACGINKEDKRRCLDWLKSLRPQNRWKPSDVQMDTLLDAIVYVEGCNSNFKGNGRVLEILYNDLKKLRKE